VGLPAVTVTVGGVVDLPNADSLFQAVGVPAGAAPQAPPDNVLLLPSAQWHQFFDPQASARPDSVRTQLHIRLAHHLPADPNAAYVTVQQLAHNVEARIAGSGIVGDNLAARLGGARADALYARVLFVFLGLPGVILAMLLTFTVTTAGAQRRRQEQALLRTRGASLSAVLRLESLEAIIVAIGGVVCGLLLAVIAAKTAAPATMLTSAASLVWMGIAALLGIALAVVAVMYPAWADARRATVAAARAVIGRGYRPLWQRVYLDVLLLIGSAVAFWQSASSGYQVVLAPEGVSQTAVSYQTFIAPVCLWLGVGLLTMRVWSLGLRRGRPVVAGLLRPLARGLSEVVSASLGRQHALMTRGVVLVALAFAFAVATAVFNTTYNAQSSVDAALTNGADVTVTGTTASPPGTLLAQLRALPGVSAAQSMQHRYAYVGNDLQDLYGIDPATIGQATTMANAYFGNNDARATLAALAAHPDGVLVSDETVRDYQLQPGDPINLRLQSASDQQYHVVPFHFIGVVREFPTAPKDSFLIANAGYIAQQTGVPAAEIVLLRTNGGAATVAAHAKTAVSSLAGARVTDIGSTRQTIGSSLTSVNLHGLTRLELVFAVLFVAGATGLVLALGMAERRRNYALLAALGATRGQMGAFVWSEGLLTLIGGAIIGIATGFAVAAMLVKILTGVFDPPPEAVAVPWPYIAGLVIAAIGSTVIAVRSAQDAAQRSVVEQLRGV
jgi:putative ABC transport system permease protein